jgi:hypothetical protein
MTTSCGITDRFGALHVLAENTSPIITTWGENEKKKGQEIR